MNKKSSSGGSCNFLSCFIHFSWQIKTKTFHKWSKHWFNEWPHLHILWDKREREKTLFAIINLLQWNIGTFSRGKVVKLSCRIELSFNSFFSLWLLIYSFILNKINSFYQWNADPPSLACQSFKQRYFNLWALRVCVGEYIQLLPHKILDKYL